jgi:hypothetical protein
VKRSLIFYDLFISIKSNSKLIEVNIWVNIDVAAGYMVLL